MTDTLIAPVKSASASGKEATLDWRTRAAIAVGGMLLRALGATWRLREIDRDAVFGRHDGTRYVFLLWHGEMLPCAWVHHNPTSVLISEHRDGEIITRIIRLLGLRAVRGSSSRGGARALMQCVALLKSGTDIAITPDGPRGPRHSFAAGALAIAYRARAPLVGIVSHVDRAWRLKSWDGFVIPKPFARVTVLYSAPRPVDADSLDAATGNVDAYARWMEELSTRVVAIGQAA